LLGSIFQFPCGGITQQTPPPDNMEVLTAFR
jgi:hypothetical protein